MFTRMHNHYLCISHACMDIQILCIFLGHGDNINTKTLRQSLLKNKCLYTLCFNGFT